METREATSRAINSTPHICWGVVDDHLLLFNPSDRRLHVLNNTAAMVWALADGTTTLANLIDLLSVEYDATADEIESDVTEVTERLIDSGLCVFVDSNEDQWSPPSRKSAAGPSFPDVTERATIGPFNVMGVAVAAIVKDKELRTELQRVLDPLADPSLDPHAAKGRLVYEILHDDLGFNLRVNGEYLARGTTRPLALRTLLSDINPSAISFIDDALVLHAAAAEIRGSIIVMPGASNSGKSTLVTQLCERGAAYITDEAVVINKAGLVARPYHKSMSIERGSQQKLAHLAPQDSSPARGLTWDLDPRTIGSGALSPGGEISAIVFPIYRPHTPTPIFRKIDRVETMHRLIANSFDFSALGQPVFAVLIRLANRLPAYELAHGGQNHLGLIEELARANERGAAA